MNEVCLFVAITLLNLRGNDSTSPKYTWLPENKNFNSKAGLKVHTDTVHQYIRKHICDVCNKTFTRRSNLIEHRLDIHIKPKNVICSVCNYAFNYKNALKKHFKQVHSDVRNHKCDLCEKAFKRNTTLREHKVIHSTERDFVCGTFLAFGKVLHKCQCNSVSSKQAF